AIAPTPVGFAPSSMLPEFGLSEGEGSNALFSESDVVTALKKAASDGTSLQNIRSFGGFQRRLNDISCAGCHHTRGIGGLPFSGGDLVAAKPIHSTLVPAPPHLFCGPPPPPAIPSPPPRLPPPH